MCLSSNVFEKILIPKMADNFGEKTEGKTFGPTLARELDGFFAFFNWLGLCNAWKTWMESLHFSIVAPALKICKWQNPLP
jgi:hypothetical protein